MEMRMHTIIAHKNQMGEAEHFNNAIPITSVGMF